MGCTATSMAGITDNSWSNTGNNRYVSDGANYDYRYYEPNKGSAPASSWCSRTNQELVTTSGAAETRMASYCCSNPWWWKFNI